ncbi:MAG: GNAT family protein [Pseudomonadota bacterium]
MTLFRLLPATSPISISVNDTLLLRSPQLNDFEQWSALRSASRLFLAPWEPVWPEDDLTQAGYRRRVSRYEKERAGDLTYAVFLFRQPDDALLGGIVLSNVRRGVSQAGTLGYWIGAPHARQGYMTAALHTFCRYAFMKWHLERLEAAAQPDNTFSIKLLQRLGFQEEGQARSYLRIAGERRNHILFALLPDDLKKAKTA